MRGCTVGIVLLSLVGLLSGAPGVTAAMDAYHLVPALAAQLRWKSGELREELVLFLRDRLEFARVWVDYANGKKGPCPTTDPAEGAACAALRRELALTANALEIRKESIRGLIEEQQSRRQRLLGLIFRLPISPEVESAQDAIESCDRAIEAVQGSLVVDDARFRDIEL